MFAGKFIYLNLVSLLSLSLDRYQRVHSMGLQQGTSESVRLRISIEYYLFSFLVLRYGSFILLESIFGSFDKLAKKRRVFKIETVGDCYVGK